MRRPRWRGAADDTAVVRRTGVRLAVLLVGLLCALLLVLAAVLYLRTLDALEQSLRDSLRTRAQSEVYHLVDVLGHPGRPDIRESPQEAQARGEVFIVYCDAQLRFLGGSASLFGSSIPDPRAARTAIQDRSPRFSTQGPSDEQSYLLYSLPVVRDGQTVGLVQTGVSEWSYDHTQDALLQSLLLVCILGLFAAGGITWLVVHRALQPTRDALRRQRDFVADAAHELRAPLAVLRTAAELGVAPSSEEDVQEAMEQVLLQGSHLAHLVDDLALLARVDSGAISVEHRPVDLARLVLEVASGMELLAEDRGIQLRCAVADGMRVSGDAQRIHQLLVILLDNALKYTPPGGAVALEITRQGHRVQLQVRDSGPGIDPRDLPHLFERFYRADHARSGDGAGLGLAIAHWIVTAHGGQIRAANAPHGGAVFTVLLPLLP
ncbi:MAG TPA: HAMP domain-containing sensor histidine kinase [Chloroflexota bacterium]|nr:HAMP domain-containing sensor histidine kinase [Chloroflexota bacterium]